MADKGDDDGVSLNDGGFESSVKWRFSRKVAVLTAFSKNATGKMVERGVPHQAFLFH